MKRSAGGKRDLLGESKQRLDTTPQGQGKAKKETALQTANKGMLLDDDFDMSTDPKVKRGMLEESMGTLEMGDLLDDDPYKYTKSTLKKGDGASPMTTNKKRDEIAEFSNEIDHQMPILEMDMGKESWGEPLDGQFITPSGKKNNPSGQKSMPQNDMMVDSAVLEKMIRDINTMQMKVSSIEEENATLKRQNISLRKNQKQIQDQTNAEITSAKRELQKALREKDMQISDLMEDRKKQDVSGDQQANSNILKDIQDMKKLLEQSVMKGNQQSTNPSKTEFHREIPLVDSQVVHQAPDQNMNNIHQSFGIQTTSEAPHFGQAYNAPAGGATQDNGPMTPSSPKEFLGGSVLSPQFNSNLYKNSAGGMIPGSKRSRGLDNSSTNEFYQNNSTGQWLSLIIGQKALLSSLKDQLLSMKEGLRKKKKNLLSYQRDMNQEMNSLGLDMKHSMVTKIRSNIRKQSKELQQEEKEFESEKNKYKMRKSGVELLEKSLIYVQGVGGVNKESEKYLNEIYSGFKNIEHFSKTKSEVGKDSIDSHSVDVSNSESVMIDDDFIGSNFRRTSADFAKIQNPDVPMMKKDSPIQIESQSNKEKIENKHDASINDQGTVNDGEQKESEVPNEIHIEAPQFPKSQNQTPFTSQENSRFRRGGSHDPYTQSHQRGTVYFDEYGRREEPPIHFTTTSPNYIMDSQMRNSLSYFPTSKVWDALTPASNMKRYFQTQAKWYSDMRSQVRHLLSSYS